MPVPLERTITFKRAPATLGCFLALVREAWNDPYASVTWEGSMWVIYNGWRGWGQLSVTVEAESKPKAIKIVQNKYPGCRGFKAVKQQFQPKDKKTWIVAGDLVESQGQEKTIKNIKAAYEELKQK